MNNPPLPLYDFDAGPLRRRLEQWRHLSPRRRASFLRNVRLHQAGARQRRIDVRKD